MRPELTELPALMRRLPLDERGYPVPFFVDYVDGKPDFRVMDGKKWYRCIRQNLCWVCGTPLANLGFNQTKVFVIGPMCAINRISSEPPSHRACAEWSARNCPFLARPHARRANTEDLVDKGLACPMRGHTVTESNVVGGIAITRNPGVTMLWFTSDFTVIEDHRGKPLLRIGDPVSAPKFYREGREATRAEIEHSIETGIPLLLQADQLAFGEDSPHLDAARQEVQRRYDAIKRYFPAA